VSMSSTFVPVMKPSDKRWVSDYEAWQLARKVSALLWNYFEPHSGWQPARRIE